MLLCPTVLHPTGELIDFGLLPVWVNKEVVLKVDVMHGRWFECSEFLRINGINLGRWLPAVEELLGGAVVPDIYHIEFTGDITTVNRDCGWPFLVFVSSGWNQDGTVEAQGLGMALVFERAHYLGCVWC